MKIYGDTNSGNCLKVKWVCDHLALPYTLDRDRHAQGRDAHAGIPQAQQRRARCRRSNSTTAARWRNPTPSSAISRAAATSFPPDAFAAAKMDEWLFWEQYSHEPYIAVCRFQMVYLGKPASDLDPDKVKRGYAALARMEQQLAATRVPGRRRRLARRRLAAGLYPPRA